MNVESVPVVSLKEDPENARLHPERNIEAIKASLAAYGQQKPIVVGKDGTVVAGNGTLVAAKALGWEKIDIVRTDLEGAKAKAFAIADNRTAELALWDEAALAETLQYLGDIEGFDVGDIGFTVEEFDVALSSLSGGGAPVVSELTSDQDALLERAQIKAIDCAVKYLDIIRSDDRLPLHPDINIGTAAINFVRTKYQGEEYRRKNSLAFCKEQFFTAGDRGSLYELMIGMADKKIDIERSRFSNAFSIGKFSSLGLSFAGYRLPLDFPVNLAIELIEEFDAVDILDPCHGWGGRFTAFLASNKSAKSYTGFDPSPHAHDALNLIASSLGEYAESYKTHQFHRLPFEKAQLSSKFDFVLTSPPYFDVEKYAGDESSRKVYDNYENWRDGFYSQMIEKVASVLTDDGTFILQVGSQMYPLENDGVTIAKKFGLYLKERRSAGINNKIEENATEESREECLLIFKRQTMKA